MILRADKLTGKKLRFFELLFSSEFPSLAAEVVPDDPAGKVLCLLFGWKRLEELQPQAKPEAQPEAEPQTFQTIHVPTGEVFIYSGTELWPAKKVGNGWLPLWACGGFIDGSYPRIRPRNRLALSYQNGARVRYP